MVKVTIFGVGGTGTSTICDVFSINTGFISKNAGAMIREGAKELGVDISEFAKICSESAGDFDKQVDLKVKEFGERNDNFIFEGRLAWYFIPDSVKIKIVCQDEVRMQRMSERDGFSKEEILAKAKKREESDKKRYFDFYGIENYENNSNFDLILDSTNKTPDELVSEIIEYLKLN